MISITLKDGQNGYDEVGRYIERFWDHNKMVDAVICRLATSFDGSSYETRNEVATPSFPGSDIEFLYDWWEGERFIKLLGIMSLSEVDVHGGLYDEQRKVPDFTGHTGNALDYPN